jgi:hypothetical protein
VQGTLGPGGADRVGKIRSRTMCCGLALWAALVLSLPRFTDATGQSAEDTGAGRVPTPDLSGVWSARQNTDTFNASEPTLRAWAEAKFKTVKPGYGPHATALSQDPLLDCLPPGFPRILLTPFPLQIVRVRDEVIMLFEYDHYVRHIYTDRREHPKDLAPTWMGDSIGKWDRGTFVVDTVGLTEKSWLDQVGHPHSDALHVVERIKRIDHETLEDNLLFDDPKAYTKTWTGQQTFKLRPGWHLMEYVCEDHMAEPTR